LAVTSIISFILDFDGKLFLSLTGPPQYAVFVLESNGSVTPFYVDDSVPHRDATGQITGLDQIVWAYDSRYLCLNRSQSLVGAESRVY
jgi:hypothetical protein